jgi:hypothetical protein
MSKRKREESGEKKLEYHISMYFSKEQLEVALSNERYLVKHIKIYSILHQNDVQATVEFLKELTGTVEVETQKDRTHSGNYWLEWVSCHISTAGVNKTKNKIEDRIYFNVNDNPPKLLNEDQLEQVREKAAKAKGNKSRISIPRHVIAYRVKYPYAQITELGNGKNGVSHLCDADGCFRQDHLDHDLDHDRNAQRKSCVGMTLLVDPKTKTIIQEVPCKHFHTTDLCCRRLYIIPLDQWALKCIKTIVVSDE